MSDIKEATTDFLNHKLTYKPVPDQETDPIKLGLREIDRLNQVIHYTTQEISVLVKQINEKLELRSRIWQD